MNTFVTLPLHFDPNLNPLSPTSMPVSGVVINDWLVHKSSAFPDSKRKGFPWTVTHIPSGMRLCFVVNRSLALEIAHSIDPTRISCTERKVYDHSLSVPDSDSLKYLKMILAPFKEKGYTP